MAKTGRILKRVFLFGVALCIAIAAVVCLNFGRIAKLAIEKFGPPLLGVPVTVGTVWLSPLNGSGGIHNLKVGNPPGFSEPWLFELGSIAIGIDVRSLSANPVRVREVIVKSPKIHWEGNFGESNVGRLQANLQRAAGDSAKHPAKSTGADRKVAIGLVRIEGAEAGVHFRGLGDPRFTVPIPTIEMHDLGGSRGASFAEVTKAIVDRIAVGVVEALRNSPEVIGTATRALQDGLGKVGSGAAGAVKSLFRR